MKQGILLVNKPADWTSFDVVNYVRHIIADAEHQRPRQIKVGHSGTLDPFATGLLILLVGKQYTRQAKNFLGQPKTYEFRLKLGATSSTGDVTGDITLRSDKIPQIRDIEAAISRFRGVIQQTPPQFSALKVNGRKAYELARQGKPVELKPRQVTVYDLQLVSYSYPNLDLKAKVSSGTYIRSLGEDIGNALDVGAYTSQLNRLTIGDFDLAQAVSPNDIAQANLAGLIEVI